jgi:hypothetical protein
LGRFVSRWGLGGRGSFARRSCDRSRASVVVKERGRAGVEVGRGVRSWPPYKQEQSSPSERGDEGTDHPMSKRKELTVDIPRNDPVSPVPRSTSASSSFDPYYFGLASPTVSPPPLPDPRNLATPVRDPALIDRRGLMGLAELSTPRWTRYSQHDPLPTRDHDVFDLPNPDTLWSAIEVRSPSFSLRSLSSFQGSPRVPDGRLPQRPCSSLQAFYSRRKRWRRDLVPSQACSLQA